MTQPDKQSDLSLTANRAETINTDIARAISEILNASELSVHALKRLSAVDDLAGDQLKWLAELMGASDRIVAACSVQDVIRQHLEILIRDVEKHVQPTGSNNNNEKLLAGPQIDGQGLSQQDIDDLLK